MGRAPSLSGILRTVNISNTGNTNFTGRLELVGNGVNMNTNANWVAFLGQEIR